MQLQAHRGVSTEFPENTMPSFQASVDQGYPIIELDPGVTKDGVCVVLHDDTLNRTCRLPNGDPIPETLPVSELTYEEVLQYDAGLHKGPAFRGTVVPRLSDVLELAAQADILVKLDNKFQRFTPWQKERFFETVAASRARVAFTCANAEMVAMVVERFPEAEIHYDGYVDEEKVLHIQSLLKRNPYTVWLGLPSPLISWVQVPTATPELCAMVKRHATLGIWILETQEQLAQAEQLGADIVETTGSLKPAANPNH